jgi:hypothetical protein
MRLLWGVLLSVCVVACSEDNENDGADGASGEAGTDPELRCPGDGWCEVARVEEQAWIDVWASSPADVWAVSVTGTVYHFDGTAWSEQARNLGSSMLSIWGTSPSDVWAGGRSEFWHWDGEVWRLEMPDGGPDDSIAAFFRDDDGTMWALGQGGAVFHRDEQVWRFEADLGGFGESILRCDGELWVAAGYPFLRADGEWWQVGLSFGAAPRAVWSDGAGEIWLGGDQLYRLAGEQWRASGGEEIARGITALAGSDRNEVWAVSTLEGHNVIRWDGSAWADVPEITTTGVGYLFATAPGELTFARKHGDLLRWDGERLEMLAPAPSILASYEEVGVVGMAGRDTAFMAYRGDLYRFTAGTAEWERLDVRVSEKARSIWATSPEDVWIVGGSSVDRFDGATMQSLGAGIPLGDGDEFLSVWGTSSNDVWIAGVTALIHWDGDTFQSYEGAASFGAIPPAAFGGDANDVWLVRGGTLSHFDGAAWSPYEWGPHIGIAGCTPDGLLGVFGDPMQLFHYDANARAVALGDVVELESPYDAWFGSTSDVWTVGTGGFAQIMHWNGAWQTSVVNTGQTLHAIWAFPSGEAFAVGGTTILHRTP